jgi:murein DD-endopeptidase MepM/ murein hydrolase activator NlpD
VIGNKRKLIIAFCVALAMLGGCASPDERSYGPVSENTITGQVHKVRSGESVYAISRKYKVSIRDVIALNNLEPPYTLNIGDNIRVPRALGPRVHVVQKGDALFLIAQKYNVSVSALAKINRVRAPYRIHVGQKLVLPNTGSFAQRGNSEVRAAAKSKKKKIGKQTRKSKAGKKKSRKKKSRGRVARAPELKAPPRSSSRFLWPVRGKVISKFGSKGKGLHNDGVNIAAVEGAPVRAAENGVVAYGGSELGGFGNLILIKHSGNFVTAYAHNSTLLVRTGQRVRRGQTIAKVGKTGAVGRPQLHFEIRKGRRPVNPLRYLTKRHAQR